MTTTAPAAEQPPKPRTRRTRAAANKTAEQPAAYGDQLDVVDAAADADGGALVGVVIPPELTFVTPKKDRPEQTEKERALNFSIDGEVYTLIRPAKLRETLAPLIESQARRATEADALFAGQAFLRKVISAESLARINARLDDDADDFSLEDLFGALEQIAVTLIRTAPPGALGGRPAPVPARRNTGR